MLKSCQYCGRLHPAGYTCPKKPRYDKQRNSAADKFRKTYAWRMKRGWILDRDYHLCRICFDGKYGRYDGRMYGSGLQLQVHHIEPLEEAFDLRLEDENLLSCCPWHHKMAEDGEIPRAYLHELAQTPPRWSGSENTKGT